jgi:histidine decarboxylase
VTGGATEGTLYGLWLARRLHPRAVVFHSTASHPSVAKAIDVLGMRSVVLRADEHGELDYADLADQVGRRRHRPIIVVANVGTTMTEAVDDVRQILGVLDAAAVPAGRRFVLADAALSGIPLALLDPTDRPGFDLADGADAVVVSGHKFLSTPMPCAVVVVKASTMGRAAPIVAYTGSPDTTISSSRNGHAALAVWYALTLLGREGLAARVRRSRELATYLHTRLGELGWPAWRRPNAMTVTLATPPAAVRAGWALASQDGRSHIVCVPGVARERLDTLLTDLTTCHIPPPSAAGPQAPGVDGHRSRLSRQLRRAAPAST